MTRYYIPLPWIILIPYRLIRGIWRLISSIGHRSLSEIEVSFVGCLCRIIPLELRIDKSKLQGT